MNHPDQTYGKKRLPADSPALATFNEAIAPELRNPIGFTPNNAQRAKNARHAKGLKVADASSFNDGMYAELAASYEQETGFKGALYYPGNENFKRIVAYGDVALPYLVTDLLEADKTARWQVAATWAVAQGVLSAEQLAEMSSEFEGRKELAIQWAVSRMLEEA